MKKIFFILSLLFCVYFSFGQDNISGPVVRTAVAFDVSIPLRDMKPAKKHFWERWKRENDMEVPNKFRSVPPGFKPDGALQTVYNNGNKATATIPIMNFDGTNNGQNLGRVTPPDPAGDVGPNHYVQLVNAMLQIFNKTGTSLYGPVQTSTLWNGFTGNWTGHNNGDGIVVYDEDADRWIISQFAIDCTGSPYTEYEMVAISTTGDPTGTYYRYAFQFDYMPDYPKFGIWQDGYYLSVNRFNTNTTGKPFVGVGACVLERSKMLTGDPTARLVYFKTETLGGSGSGAGNACWSMLPSDCDGTFAAAGTPNYFAYIDGSSELRLWAFHTDWTTTTNCTFTYVTALPVAAYTEIGSGSVPEQGTLSLDGLGDRLMFRNQYRNFGSYETFVTCHSVNTGSSVAGIRWYEYRKTGSTFSLYQQSTFAPGDGKSRWMGSIAMNANGDIGLAYSVSSSTMFPSIYFTGRKAADPLNQMTIAEGLIQTGTVSMTTYSRWGDYTALNVDPIDNSFWTNQEYVGTYGGWCPWATKIASFRIPNQPAVVTQAATAITLTTATLNGTVNPHGLATTYHFDWGTSTSYGNVTTSQSAGSGSTATAYSANLTGLTTGITYHYRISATNSDGQADGLDMTFTPGAAIVATTAAFSITATTATAGGNVTTDGGLTVTARGTCWGTTANPTISGSHTTDGSGTGTFTSSLTGLTGNTIYHNRAYATNGAGTFYGNDLSFTTQCGIYTVPFSESFTATTIPSCWSQVDNVGAGNIWQFGVITTPTPVPALTGNYAYLNSNAYGTGVTENADLVTPMLNFTGYINVTLQFNHYFRFRSPSSATLSYSINGGSTWTQIQQWITTTANPAAFSQVINAVDNQSQVKFKWNYTGTHGYWWAVDDVLITGSCPTVSVSIAPSANPVCAGTSVTFTATPTNGGTAPSYQWKVNGINVGTNSPTYSYMPVNNDHVNVILTSSLTCATGNPATSNTVTMTVNPYLPVSVSISPSANPVCAGTSVTFTATPTNGGTAPSYQWFKNTVAVGTGSTYSYVPVTGDQVYIIMTSSLACTTGNPATSGTVTMTVSPNQPVSVSIAPSSNPVCAGTSVTFTATPANGGTAPSYQWFKNTVAVGTGSTYSYVPVTGDQVYIIMTSSLACTTGNPATSGTVTMTVNPNQPVSVSIAPSANPVCAGISVTFTATPANGGTAPSYQWKVNGINVGTNSPTYSYVPVNNDHVNVILTSSLTCATGNPATSSTVTMTVNPYLPVSVSMSPSANPVCAGTSVTFTATPANGGTAPSYQWKVNGINVGTNSLTYSYVPVNNDHVNVILTSSLTCVTGNPATSNTVTMTVNPNLPVSVSIAPSANPVCVGTSVTFTATPANGGTAPSYQWKVNGINVGTNSLTYSYVPVNNDQVYVIMTSNATCATGNPATSNEITITVNPLPTPEISGPATVEIGQVATYTTANSGNSFLWNAVGGTYTTSTTNTFTVTWGTVTGTGSVSVVETTPGGACSGSNNLPVTITPCSYTISGIVQYNNTFYTPLNDVVIQLYKDSTYIGTTTSATEIIGGVQKEGYYQFTGLSGGNYNLVLSYPTGTWGGVNATDALVIELYTCCGYSLPGLLWKAGDVDTNAVVNGTDALWVKYRVVNLENYFPEGDWVFGNGLITVVSDTTYNLKLLCTGDVNASYIPTGFKSQSFISVVDDGTRYISTGQSFNYDIKPSINTKIGAMTLFLGYDVRVIEVEDVKSNIGDLQSNVTNSEIGLAWSNSNPATMNENEPIISLKMRSKEFIETPIQSFVINDGSEFANADANLIYDLNLKMARIATVNNSFSLTNHPNPFQNTTDIVYTLPEQGHVKLIITNLFGEELHTLVDADKLPGSYTIRVNPFDDNLKPGIYLYKIRVDGVTTTFLRTNKMVFTR